MLYEIAPYRIERDVAAATAPRRTPLERLSTVYGRETSRMRWKRALAQVPVISQAARSCYTLFRNAGKDLPTANHMFSAVAQLSLTRLQHKFLCSVIPQSKRHINKDTTRPLQLRAATLRTAKKTTRICTPPKKSKHVQVLLCRT